MTAIGTLAGDPESLLSDLILGLAHPDVISSYAAMSLYRRTGRRRPEKGSEICKDPIDWAFWLLKNGSPKPQETVRILLAVSLISADRASLLEAAILSLLLAPEYGKVWQERFGIPADKSKFVFNPKDLSAAFADDHSAGRRESTQTPAKTVPGEIDSD